MKSPIALHPTVAGDRDALVEHLFSERLFRHTLENGLVVVHKEDFSSALVSLQVWVGTGSIHEHPLLGGGVSHYLEHMLFKGTGRRSAHEIAREVQAFGGAINAYTTFDRTVYYIDAPSEATAAALDILGDQVFASVLDPDETIRERDVILREIDMGRDDPDRRLSRLAFQNAFRAHPYRDPVIGHREVFETVAVDDLAAYYRRRYVPNNVTLVVVGAISREELAPLVESHFGGIKRGRLDAPVVPTEPQQLAYREEHATGDVQVCRGSLTFKVPGLRHPDAVVLDVLGNALGSGQSGILWQELRQHRRLVHSIEGSVWNPGEAGLFWIGYTCDSGRGAEVEAAVHEVLESVLEEGVEPWRVEKARRQLMSAEVNIRKTMRGQAGRLGAAEVVVGDLGYTRAYLERIGTVEPSGIAPVAREWLRRERLTSVTLDRTPAKPPVNVAAARRRALVDFEEVCLDNGARLLLQPDAHLPKAHLRATFLGGPGYEPASRRGLTQLMATLLTCDTAMRSNDEVASVVEAVGGSFRESAGNNTFGISVEMLADDFALMVDVADQALNHAQFLEDTVTRERDAQVAEIKEELDEIFEAGRRALRNGFFGDHALAVEPMGEADDLELLEPRELEAHARRLMVPENVVLAIAGDFDVGRARDVLGGMVGHWGKSGFEKMAPEWTPPERRSLQCPMEREQCVVFHGYPGPGAVSPAHPVATVLDEVLSEMSGVLFTRVREEQGLAYFVGASQVVGVDQGMFYLYCGTHPDAVAQVEAEFEREIERVRTGRVTAEELSRCQARLKAQKRMSLQTIGSRAADASLNALYGQPVNRWRQFDAEVDAIDIDQLAEFARTWLNPDHRVALVAGPVAVATP